MSAGLLACSKRPGGGTLLRLGRMVDANTLAARAAKQSIDRHAIQLAGDVPQRHVDAGQRVDHERAAAHVAMRPEQLLPQMLDPRRVLAIEQIEERFREDFGRSRIDRLDVTPAGDAVIGLDTDEEDGTDPPGPQARDTDGGGAIGHLRRGISLGACGVGEHCQPSGDGPTGTRPLPPLRIDTLRLLHSGLRPEEITSYRRSIASPWL